MAKQDNKITNEQPLVAHSENTAPENTAPENTAPENTAPEAPIVKVAPDWLQMYFDAYPQQAGFFVVGTMVFLQSSQADAEGYAAQAGQEMDWYARG
jgi:hypothetical protein